MTLKLYWATKPESLGPKNFGDALSPIICEYLSGQNIVWSPPKKAEIIAIGSILGKISPGKFSIKALSKKVNVWGSGFMHASDRQDGIHNYHAVRGQLTLDRIEKPRKTPVLGDPGLLVDRIFKGFKSASKDYEFGVVPHKADKGHSSLHEIQKKLGSAIVIDIDLPPKDFISLLTRCNFILSSSLHGLIAADSFDIPNCWIELSNKVRGNGFKFHDYYTAFSIIEPQKLTPDEISISALEAIRSRYERQDIDKIKDRLVSAFPC